MTDGHRAGLLAIAVTSLLWGTTGTAATFAPDVGPLAVGAAALGIGGLLQAVVGARSLQASAPLLRPRRMLVLVGALAVAVYPLAFYTAMHTAGVAVGSVVSLASAPLASGVLERALDRHPLSRWWVLAAVLGVLGSVLLCLSSVTGSPAPEGPHGADGTAGAPGSTTVGVALGLVAGASYAVYSWASRRLMVDGVPRAAAMGAVFGGGGLLLVPVLAVTGAPLIASAQNAAVGAYMALVPMFLGYLLFGYGLSRVPASTATTVTLTEPAVATVLAVLVVGERLTAVGWAGLGVIALVLVVLAVAPTNTTAGGPPDRRPR
ncbi:DMT family transporter [Curtobacterium sp. MCBD17_021]|uniref:DMT family transporter n=1 Tax=Curtobacterium sp. MCBD17_021 TaxID=2175665 RepID=UPI000DAA6D64|nr:EamA family transporter [Curtobacterium sp. MCBD17_021]PZE69520.1 EamA/RhaT family transporter [Curtobacterium sp. MCBD17_021]